MITIKKTIPKDFYLIVNRYINIVIIILFKKRSYSCFQHYKKIIN